MQVREISDTIQEFNGIRYYKCGDYFSKQNRRLHRDVWGYYNGRVDKGFHIHHKDGNRSNNQIENLKLMSATKHQRLHGKLLYKNGRKENWIKATLDGAKKWHGSTEGKKWHKQQYQKYCKSALERTYPAICKFCECEFKTRHPNQAKFCSQKCKQKWRRLQGIDNEIRICEWCKKEFGINKYEKTRFCSRSCAGK